MTFTECHMQIFISGCIMEYKDLYYTLFNRITDVIEELKEIQKMAEELYISSDIDSNQDETKKVST